MSALIGMKMVVSFNSSSRCLCVFVFDLNERECEDCERGI